MGVRDGSDAYWHPGELMAQERAGVAEEVDAIGLQRMLRPFVPGQHAAFYANQPMLFIGSASPEGKVWASVVAGQPGFIDAGDGGSRQLTLNPLRIAAGDPLLDNLGPGACLGMLGLELWSRRRNRVNGRVTDLHKPEAGQPGRLVMDVDVTFGNCPKYIQARDLELDGKALAAVGAPRPVVQGGKLLGEAQARLVRLADTMFLASCYCGKEVPRGLTGCDMSHRGGQPGFISVEEATAADGTPASALRWGDWPGNNMFQTLGNLLENPACGILIIDWPTGSTLQITGRASVSFDPKDTGIPGVTRQLSFEVHEWIYTSGALPIRQVGQVKYSHYNPALPIKPINGPTAKGLKEIPATAPTSAPVRCISVRDEALGVKTFEFALPPTQILPAVSTLKAGQYATFEADVPTAEGGNATQTVVRTWTISSHPLQMAASGSFTITVKREGKVSAWLHETMRPGSKADPRFRCIGFGGTFVPHPVPAAKAPSISGANGTCKAGALLLAGGIGITPLRSILCDLLGPACGHDSVASEQAPRCLDHIALIYSVRDPREAAFLPELAAFAAKSGSSGSGGEGAHCKTSMSVILTVTGSQVKQAANGDHSSEQPQDWAVQQARGRLSTQVVQQYVLGPLGAESLADKGWVWQVYMCGPPGYMAAAEASLQELGMPPNRIYQESFKF